MYTPPFTVTDEILHLVSEISEQIGTLNTFLGERMPSPMLRKENQIKTIHSSLAIEHNSLSLQQVTDNVGINVGVNVGINEQRVLDALRADASLSAVKIGRLLGITTRQAERLLASLREKNLIRRIGANKNGHWEIIK